MSTGVILSAWMAFFILCPVLTIRGHFIYLPELFLYLIFIYKLILFPINYSRYKNNNVFSSGAFRAHVVYGVLFLATVLLTAHLSDESINNFDLYILRNIIQVVLCLKLFDKTLQNAAKTIEFDRILFNVIIVLCVPAVIVYIQRLDIFSLRDVIIDLYKTQYFFLGKETFRSYRYASVFKDFFTSAVYFTMLASFIFYFSMKTILGLTYRVVLVVFLAVVYGAQFFVARSSLIMIPLLIGAISLFGIQWSAGVLVRRIIPLTILIGLVGFVSIHYLLGSGLVNNKWALEASTFMSSEKKGNSASFEVMQNDYRYLSRNISNNKNSIFSPKHTYNLTETTAPGRYTDSFYGQEIYRYGIYGMIAYLVYLTIMIIAHLPKNRYVVLLVIALSVMNYKGGNTFFMPKNIYLYAFILAVIPYIDSRRNSIAGKFIKA